MENSRRLIDKLKFCPAVSADFRIGPNYLFALWTSAERTFWTVGAERQNGNDNES
jgi:hypothetical protein